jgi:hypothetical protein
LLKGRLEELSLLDMCRLVRNAGETGVLTVRGDGGSGLIYFASGRIRHARSSRVPVGFARDLVVRGQLSEDQLRRVTELCAKSGEPIEKALVSHGLVSKDAVDTALRREALAAALDLLRWDSGSFEFDQGTRLEGAHPASLEVDELVSKAQYLDAIDGLEKSVVRVARLSAASGSGDRAPALRPHQWHVLALVDGRRTVLQIVQEARVNLLTVAEALLGLLEVGVVSLEKPRRIDLRTAESPDRTPEGLEALVARSS